MKKARNGREVNGHFEEEAMEMIPSVVVVINITGTPVIIVFH